MNYKVGDIVKIKANLVIDEFYGRHMYNKSMDKYKEFLAYIKTVLNDTYKLDVDNGDWCWTEEMLEPIEVKSKDRKNTHEDRNMKYILDRDKTIVIQYYIDKDGVKRYRKGVSKKHPLDVYNEGIGVLMSVADAYGIDKKLIHIGECACHKNDNNINKNKEEKELEFINKFKEYNIGVNVQSKKEAENFIELLYKYNLIRKGNMNSFINRYDIYKEDTSYTYNFGNFGSVGWDSVNCHKKVGWEIIQYKDIFKNDINLATVSTEDLLEELKKRVK